MRCRAAPDAATVVSNTIKHSLVSWKHADYGHKVHSIFFLSIEAQHIYLHLESGQLLSFLTQLYVRDASHQNSSATGSTGGAFGSLVTSQNKVLGKSATALLTAAELKALVSVGRWRTESKGARKLLECCTNYKRPGIQTMLQ